jgi:hypothetical protein
VSDSTDQDMPVWAIRLESKVDIALTQQGGRLDRHGEILDDHEKRIRSVESQEHPDPETEKRLRAVETKMVVTPAGLAMALTTIFAALGGFTMFIEKVTQ